MLLIGRLGNRKFMTRMLYHSYWIGSSLMLDSPMSTRVTGVGPSSSVGEHPGSPQEIVTAAERLSEKRTAFGYMELVREGCRLSSGESVN